MLYREGKQAKNLRIQGVTATNSLLYTPDRALRSQQLGNINTQKNKKQAKQSKA